jgi:UDP-N-acetylmuramoylalanine--D-glutamate ligase
MTEIPPLPRGGEVAVIGLARSGLAAIRLLRQSGMAVYGSDSGLRPPDTGGDSDVEWGRHDISRIQRASMVVVSPGIPPDASPLKAAREARVPIISEVELGLRTIRDSHFVTVTGTNGKSTTTALTAHLLSAAGHTAREAGNIGMPLCEIALERPNPEWIALELSSFQLHETPSVPADIGVFTNLSPDHLDRYSSVADYYADKALFFRNATKDSKWVLNADDPAVEGLSNNTKGSRAFFSVAKAKADAGIAGSGDDTVLVIGKNLLIRRKELRLLGEHNVSNALAAALAVFIACGEDADAIPKIAEGLKSFHGLPHRLEIIAEKNGVLWINDSKATNVNSSLVAIQSMNRPTVLLLGGRHKGEPYTALSGSIRKRVKQIIAYGEAGETIERDLTGTAPVARVKGKFDDVVAAAKKAAAPGDAVLLSPACSSYDMFRNFEERGDRFRNLVEDMNG